MKWTGTGVLTYGKKNNVINHGETIPDGILDKDRIKKFKKEGKIDGRLSQEAFEAAQAQVEKNIKKKAAGPVDDSNDNKPKTKKELGLEVKALKAKLKDLDESDPEIQEIEIQIEELKKQIKAAK